MMMGYIFWDILSPLSTIIKSPDQQGGLGWTATEYGLFAGAYSTFNVFLLMLFWGGIILDRMGIRFTGIMATALMLCGAVVCYYSMNYIDGKDFVHLPILGQTKWQVAICALGFGIFGVGCDITGITISKIITKWFQGRELATAMGIQVAFARVGTALAISLSPLIALKHGLTAPVAIGSAHLLFGFLLFIVYTLLLHRKAPTTASAPVRNNPKTSPEQVGGFRILPFILIVLLCVAFYSSIRPFLKFATDLLINKFGMDSITAGWIVSLLPYGTIVLTPLFGNLYDRIGRGATLMLIGTFITLGCHLTLMLTQHPPLAIAIAVLLLLGVAFSLVPSAMWASIPQIVPYKRLGIGYAVIFYIQNLGLMFVPVIVGQSIDAHTTTTETGALSVDYTQPMAIFVLISILSVIVATVLLIVDKQYAIGLEQPNISN